MKKMNNASHIEGKLYEADLQVRESGPNSKKPGTKFIMGTVSVATDNAMTNIVPVHYTYVTEKTSKNTDDARWKVLKDIIDGKTKTVMRDGADAAAMVRIDSAIDLNEFYSDRNGTEELVSVKRNEGGFIHLTNQISTDEKLRSTFDCDIVITSTRRIEANEERDLPEKMIVKGAIFNFRNQILPVEFTVLHPGAMNYFEGLDASNSNPVFTRVKGNQVSQTVVRKITEESAFGEPSVREVTSSSKDFVITWAAKEVYEWDDESTITVAEFKKCIADREVTVADIKKRRDEYVASKSATPAAATVGGFNF